MDTLSFLSDISSNKMFVGVTMILMNLGSRHIVSDLTDIQNSLLSSKLMKKVVVFCMFFVPTRDVMVSLMLTFAFFFLTGHVLNERKGWNITKAEDFDELSYKDSDVYAIYEASKRKNHANR